jgi:hypothetical protein
MILLFAVLFGCAVGIARSAVNQATFATPDLRLVWLVFLAFAPQFFLFFLPETRTLLDFPIISIGLLGSQLLLLIFVFANWRQPGFFLLGLGLFANLLVITLNGGMMPISPETIARLAPPEIDTAQMFQSGSRFGTSKDIVLPRQETHLWWLSDTIILFPYWFPLEQVISAGDILLSLGVIRFFWAAGKKKT